MPKKKKVKKPEAPKTDTPKKGEVQERDFGGLPDRDLKKNLGCG